MGKAISHKVSSKGENNLISYAASAMQGCYHQMEDFVSFIRTKKRAIFLIKIVYLTPDIYYLQRTTVLDLGVRPGTSFFAVYDGHGGFIFVLILLLIL